MSADHERIYLQPACCANRSTGRLWCQDPDPEECEGGVPWTEYVRADAVAALREREERYREALTRMVRACTTMMGPGVGVRVPDRDSVDAARRALEGGEP